MKNTFPKYKKKMKEIKKKKKPWKFFFFLCVCRLKLREMNKIIAHQVHGRTMKPGKPS